MNGFTKKYERACEVAGLGVLALAIGVSFGCEWDAETLKRFEASQKALCETITSASGEKSKCLTLFPDNRTRREDCINNWDSLLRELHKIKAQAAAAFGECDDETLDALKKAAEKAVEAAAEAAGKKVAGFRALSLCKTNFADPLNHSPMTVSMSATMIAQAGSVRTYALADGSYWQVSFDGGASVETYPASGTLTFDVGPGQADLLDMSVSLDLAEADTFGYLEITDNVANPISFRLMTDVATGLRKGRLCGWLDYARDFWGGDGGSYVTSLPAAFASDFSTVTLSTAVGVGSGKVFPSDPPPTSEFILYANFNTDVVIGQWATIEVDGLEPGASIWIHASDHLVAPSGTFGGTTWVLDPAGQFLVSTGTADAAGYVSMSIPIPDDPSLVGTTFFFQGIATTSSGFVSTIPFAATVAGP